MESKKTEKEIKKSCGNCRFFSQHYSKQGIRYSPVYCGHCINRNNKKMMPLGVCDFWEDITILKEERKKVIKESLIDMAEKLDEIAMILKDDL